MDGVLVNSESFWQRFWREQVFAYVKNGDPGLEEVNGRNFRESLEDLAEKYNLPGGPEQYARKFENAAKTVYGEDVSLTPGIPEFYEMLRLHEVHFGIVSSAPKAWIEIVIDRFDLAPIDVVVTAKQVLP